MNFTTTDVGDTHVLVPVGKATANFNSIISLNDMGETIWNMLESDVTREALLDRILAEYDVSAQQAAEDMDRFLETLRGAGCIEE